MDEIPACYYITVATKPHPVLDKLLNKTKNMGETLIVLGESEGRTIGWEATGNFGVKLREFVNFVNSPELAEDDIVLFTDAYDVAYFGNRRQVIHRFSEFKKPIVFGSERYCFPDQHLKNQYPDLNHEFPYLNSGMCIGYVWAFRRCVAGYCFNDGDIDQRFWTRKFLENLDLIELDYENRLFINMCDIEMAEFSCYQNRIFYKERNPLFIHFNGPDKKMIYDYL
jgi:hypothetical protein